MYTIGIDEVGRGPIAGPVVVCACAVKEKVEILHLYPKGILRDSKKLSEKQRGVIVSGIQTLADSKDILFGIGESSAEYIDEHGIVPAIKHAMESALTQLYAQGVQNDAYVYLDGALRAPSSHPQETIIKGDEKVLQISLASIYAKEYRDTMMKNCAQEFPEYGFESHVGYGTPAHYQAIATHGITKLHRKSFITRS